MPFFSYSRAHYAPSMLWRQTGKTKKLSTYTMLFEYKLDSSLPLMRSSSPSAAAAWNEGGHSKIKWPHFFGNIGSNIPSPTLFY